MSVRERNKRIPILGQDNNALTWLIIINAVIFLALLFIKLVYQMSGDTGLQSYQTQIADWFTLPASITKLLTRPWTIITYMVSHDNLWYLISSLLWLWCFGYILQDLAGNGKIIPIYFYGGIVAAITFIASANLFASLKPDVDFISQTGAAASVVAIAVAVTTLAPNYRVFQMMNGGIPIWIITIIFIAIDFGTVGMVNGAVALSHVASGLTGFAFVKQLRKGNDLGLWMTRFSDWVNDLFNPEKKVKANQSYYKPTRKPYQKTLHVTQQKLDEILDKINSEGYQYLSDDEKEFLKKASNTDL
ncbi:MAG TPA: rhomboid family intramembrane serine protease [Parafilimonas sp.]|nr:rhomboid family intramembrane serine protease [Parafilimonas sp.]